MGPDLTSDLVRLLMLAPDGVLRRSNAAGSFVVASVNLGVIESSPDEIRIAFLPRSSVASAMTDTKHALRALASSFGFDIEFDSEYPGWSFAEISPIRDVFAQSYRAMTGKDLKIEAVHAGLECGLFSEKLPGLDAISRRTSLTATRRRKNSIWRHFTFMDCHGRVGDSQISAERNRISGALIQCY